MRAFKKIISLLIILLLFVFIFIVDSVIESNQIKEKVHEFKERGELVYEYNNKHFYKVLKAYEYEDTSSPILREYSESKVGTTGDIHISNRDPIDFFLTEHISKYIYIGHSGMVYDENEENTVEVSGNISYEDNVVKTWKNSWLYGESPNYIFLRVKGMNDEKKTQFKEECDKLMGQSFNYNFICKINNKHYCSELVSYVYEKLGYNLNEDYYATTGADYIVDDDTYIIFYQEQFIKENKVHYNIYYLAGE